MELDGNQYRTIVESAPNLIWRANTDALCDYFNQTWLAFTGRTMEQEYGNGWAEVVHPDDFDRCLEIYLGSFSQREPFEMEYRLRRHDGEWRWINDRGVPFYNDQGDFAGYIGSCIDITEKIEGALYREMAHTDSLTGIRNRLGIEQIAKNELIKFKELNKELCIVLTDLDSFKQINDNYGHPFGDTVLKLFTGFLQENIRHTDILGRYGGDEFIIIMPDTAYENAAAVMKRMLVSLKERLFTIEGREIHMSFSYGVASSTRESSYESMVSTADVNMYEMKKLVFHR